MRNFLDYMLKSFLAPRNKAENVILEIVRWVCRCERIEKKSRPVKDDSMNGPEKSLFFCFLSLFVSVVAQDNTVAGVFYTFDCDGDFADA